MNMKEEERRPRAAKMQAVRTPMKIQPEPHEEDQDPHATQEEDPSPPTSQEAVA
jgi:hypothetical protein